MPLPPIKIDNWSRVSLFLQTQCNGLPLGKATGFVVSKGDKHYLITNWHVRGWTPMGRLGTPADVARVVGLFCSEDADWITGQVIYADGGASLMNPEVPTEIQIG